MFNMGQANHRQPVQMRSVGSQQLVALHQSATGLK
jgi:hypothetical protein